MTKMFLAASTVVFVGLHACNNPVTPGGTTGDGVDAALVGTWDKIGSTTTTTGYFVATSTDISISGSSLSEGQDPYSIVSAKSGQIYLQYGGAFSDAYPDVYLFDYAISSDTMYLVSEVSSSFSSPGPSSFEVTVCVKQ